MSCYLRGFYSIVGFIFIASIVSQAQTISTEIDDLVMGYAKQRQFNGTVLVSKNGVVIHSKGYGFANFETQSPAETDTKYRLASVTKQFTAMAVMQLVEQGKISLTGTISDYLPDYPSATGKKVTVHHLLTHTSGIPSYTGFPGFMQKSVRDPYQPQDFIKFFKDSSLQFTPGESFAYNNSAYFLLGVIIEKVTGKSYADVIDEQIFKPLGMKNSGYDAHARLLRKRASGYQMNGSQLVNAPYIDMTIPYAAGSLYSTVEDLFIWDTTLYTEKLVKRSTMDKIFTPYVIADGRIVYSYYGYGWFLRKEQIGKSRDSVDAVEHGGGIFGFATSMFRVPKTKHSVIILSNLAGSRLREMTRGILGILYNAPYDKAKQSLAQTLRGDIAASGLEKAIAAFRSNKAKESEYYQSESELNGLGYELLGQKKLTAAVEVFKLAVELYPKSSNVYDSLGEAYMVSGNKENAVKNYEKSLELNPANTNAKDMLKTLKSK